MKEPFLNDFPPIPFNKPFIVGKELYNISYAVLKNAWLSGDGEFSKKCHAWLVENLQCKAALLTNSCTSALEMAALLFDVGPGDEVIMPSFTFVSTANAFVLRGATPVFVDIRPDTLNMDEGLVEEALTEHTKVVVPVHYAGVACEMSRLLDIARENNLWMVEDAAQALFALYNGKPLGSFGHLGCLSFHETKNIICGEGGALLINDEKLIERAQIIREKGTNRSMFLKGQVDKYTWVDLGSSFLPSELTAAFLYAQMEHVRSINEKRCGILDRYEQELAPLQLKGKLRLPIRPEGAVCNGHLMYILTNTAAERDALLDHLRARNIHAVFHFIPLHSSPGGKKYCRIHGSMHNTESIASRIIRLPLFYEMTDEEIHRTVDAIMDFYDK